MFQATHLTKGNTEYFELTNAVLTRYVRIEISEVGSHNLAEASPVAIHR